MFGLAIILIIAYLRSDELGEVEFLHRWMNTTQQLLSYTYFHYFHCFKWLVFTCFSLLSIRVLSVTQHLFITSITLDLFIYLFVCLLIIILEYKRRMGVKKFFRLYSFVWCLSVSVIFKYHTPLMFNARKLISSHTVLIQKKLQLPASGTTTTTMRGFDWLCFAIQFSRICAWSLIKAKCLFW